MHTHVTHTRAAYPNSPSALKHSRSEEVSLARLPNLGSGLSLRSVAEINQADRAQREQADKRTGGSESIRPPSLSRQQG